MSRMTQDTLPVGGKLGLTREEAQWVKAKWGKIRASSRKADEANNTWQRLNDEINDYMDRKGETDIVQRTKIKGQNIPLADALATGNWHSRNAERHIHDLNLFLRLKELELI